MPLDPFDLNNVAILLDVDGTFLDIAPTPHDAYVPSSVQHMLRRVTAGACGALALVSGRALKNLDKLFDPLRLPAIGGHGAEIRPYVNGEIYSRRGISLDGGLKRRLKEIAQRHPGVAVEDKGYSLGLHYRSALERELDVVNDVFQLCKAYRSDSFDLLAGEANIEVKAAGFSTGTAVRELMRYPPFAGRTPIFVGDDTIDETAFAVMPELHGVAISVGRKVPGILDMFQTPSDVRNWLVRLSQNVVLPH